MPIVAAGHVRQPYVGSGLVRLADLGLVAARSRANAERDRGERSAQQWSMAGNAIAQGIGTVRQEQELVPLRMAAQAKMARETEIMRRQDKEYTRGEQARGADAAKAARLQEVAKEYPGARIPTERLIQEFGPVDASHIDKAFDELFPKAEKKPTREIKRRNADGSEVIEIVEDTPGQTFNSAAPVKEPKLHPLTVPGPNGQPMTKMFTEEQMQAGVQTYRAPTQGPAPDNVLVPIVGPDGKTRYGSREEARGQLVPAGSAKPATGLEKRALAFFNRAQQADTDLETMEAEVQKLNLGAQTYMQYAPNFAQTELGQQYTQAQRAFTEARLRKDSGAAIPDAEFENDRKTYFAQPGDSKTTLEQKRRARGAVLASLGFESGQALGEFVGDPEEAKRVVDGYRERAKRTDAPPAEKKNPFRK